MAMSSSIVSIVTMLATTSLRSTHILILELSHKSSGLDKNNTTVVSPSVVLKGDEKAEKRKEEFGGKFNCHRGGKRTTWCKIKASWCVQVGKGNRLNVECCIPVWMYRKLHKTKQLYIYHHSRGHLKKSILILEKHPLIFRILLKKLKSPWFLFLLRNHKQKQCCTRVGNGREGQAERKQRPGNGSNVHTF
ncbi:uncharacterized protein [Henckelia pumila]|uniref:uncharacterized protein isoform X2 n=1 Tax=Henckelia pumila TaxID=405737 RepID=UPI003C6E566A